MLEVEADVCTLFIFPMADEQEGQVLLTSSLIHVLQYYAPDFQRNQAPRVGLLLDGTQPTLGEDLYVSFTQLGLLWGLGSLGLCWFSQRWPHYSLSLVAQVDTDEWTDLSYSAYALNLLERHFQGPQVNWLYADPYPLEEQEEGHLGLNHEMTTIFFERAVAHPAIIAGRISYEHSTLIEAGYMNMNSYVPLQEPSYYPRDEPLGPWHPAELATPFVLHLQPPRGYDYGQALYSVQFLRSAPLRRAWSGSDHVHIHHALTCCILQFSASLRFGWVPTRIYLKVIRRAYNVLGHRAPRVDSPFQELNPHRHPLLFALLPDLFAPSQYGDHGMQFLLSLQAVLEPLHLETEHQDPDHHWIPVRGFHVLLDALPENIFRHDAGGQRRLRGRDGEQYLNYGLLRAFMRDIRDDPRQQRVLADYFSLHQLYFEYGDNLNDEHGAEWSIDRVLVHFGAPGSAPRPDRIAAARDEYRDYYDHWLQERDMLRQRGVLEDESQSNSSREQSEGPELEIYH